MRRVIEELFNQRRLEIAPGIFAEGLELYSPAGVLRGLDAAVQPILDAAPDYHAEIVTLIAEADEVWDRITVSASLSGEVVQGEVVHLWRVSDGRLTECRGFMTPRLQAKLSAAVASLRS